MADKQGVCLERQPLPVTMSTENRLLMRGRQASSFEVGNLAALMMTDAAPTPCSRTGFHITTSSL